MTFWLLKPGSAGLCFGPQAASRALHLHTQAATMADRNVHEDHVHNKQTRSFLCRPSTCGKCRESRLTRCGVRSLFALVTPLLGGYEIY